MKLETQMQNWLGTKVAAVLRNDDDIDPNDEKKELPDDESETNCDH